jgi:hypothetical protein
MKIKQILFAVITGLLLTAGLARAAQSFDLVTTSSHVNQIVSDYPSPSCIIEN